ncbi:hypothetical protein BDR03DRAFT_580508 [Suillus americanus]|nr:hypothetical protein BDR03DRAFT_580508 [Suillus americanus]
MRPQVLHTLPPHQLPRVHQAHAQRRVSDGVQNPYPPQQSLPVSQRWKLPPPASAPQCLEPDRSQNLHACLLFHPQLIPIALSNRLSPIRIYTRHKPCIETHQYYSCPSIYAPSCTLRRRVPLYLCI